MSYSQIPFCCQSSFAQPLQSFTQPFPTFTQSSKRLSSCEGICESKLIVGLIAATFFGMMYATSIYIESDTKQKEMKNDIKIIFERLSDNDKKINNLIISRDEALSRFSTRLYSLDQKFETLNALLNKDEKSNFELVDEKKSDTKVKN